MPTSKRAGIRLDELAERTGVSLEGDGGVLIDAVASLDRARAGSIAFLSDAKRRSDLATTQASAVIVRPADAAATALPRLVSANPYATYAKVATILHPPAPVVAGIHPTAIVGAGAAIAADACIGPYAVIGERASIGSRVEVGPACVIGDEVELGDDVRLVARVTIYAGCTIGARTIVHAGAVIGADGFGNAEEAGRWIKIPQVGSVVVGADCEIGANTTIDRGAIGDTVIEDDVKLDNQIQVGHNCFIGRHTAIAGCAGIAGSARIGRNCKIGGAAGINGHIEIGDNVIVGPFSGVMSSIREPGLYMGVVPSMPHREWRHVAVQIGHLRELARRVKELEDARDSASPPAAE